MIKWQAMLFGFRSLRALMNGLSICSPNDIATSLYKGEHMASEQERWKKGKYSFFSHKECEYFPCHKTEDPDNFNCLFCYCPLYALGERCGGNYRITANGYKDCTNCLIPHKRENYGYITGRYLEIMELAKSQKKQP